MACPLNIKVCISEQFYRFPYEYIVPQNDVGNQPVLNLVVYVPTEEDKQYVNVQQLAATFNSILVVHHENEGPNETRLAKKNDAATVVYWNPILPLHEVGVGETRVFSVLLTNDLFFCNTMVIDKDSPTCPIAIRTTINYKKLIPINGVTPLYYFDQLADDNVNDFLICFDLETPTMVKILNIKRILSIFGFRRVPARYAIYLPDNEVDSIFNKLMWERVRRLTKGDVGVKCANIDRKGVQYLKLALDLLGIDNSSQAIVKFVMLFQPLIVRYQLVPDIIIRLNTLEGQKRVRVYCANDSYAITSYGPVPNNMLEDNSMLFDYSDINTNKHLFSVKSEIEKHTMKDVVVTAARYNYFF